MVLIIPSAELLKSEMKSETGASTHALISLAGKPLFFHIIESYKDLKKDNDLKVVLILKTGMKKLIGHYEKYIDKCVEIDNSKNLLDTIYKGVLESLDLFDSEDNQVIIHMADTLLPGGELSLRSDVIYASEGFDFYRWTLFNESNGLVKISFDRKLDANNTKGQLIFIGILAFSSLQSLIKAFSLVEHLKSDVDPFFRAVEKYSEKIPFYTCKVKNWLDFGNLDTYYESKLNFQNIRHFNTLEFDNKTSVVTKKSKDPNFIHQVRWFQLQPPEIQFYLPRVYEYSDDANPYISMEMLTLPTLSELFVSERLDLGAWPTLLVKLKEIQDIYGAYKCQSDSTFDILFSMYVTKTVDRLNEFLFENPEKGSVCSKKYPDGISLGELPNLIEEYVDMYDLLQSKDLTPIHGDFCLTNLLYDKRSRIIKMIDPRGEFSVPGIYGDNRYDLAKIYHSILSGYDFIISDRFFVNINDDIVEHKIFKTKYHKEVGKMTQELFVKNEIINQEVRIIESLLFLSMIPLHKDRPDRQLAMISIGLELFNYYFSIKKNVTKL